MVYVKIKNGSVKVNVKDEGIPASEEIAFAAVCCLHQAAKKDKAEFEKLKAAVISELQSVTLSDGGELMFEGEKL